METKRKSLMGKRTTYQEKNNHCRTKPIYEKLDALNRLVRELYR